MIFVFLSLSFVLCGNAIYGYATKNDLDGSLYSTLAIIYAFGVVASVRYVLLFFKADNKSLEETLTGV